jgi:hypothetical protein
MAELDGGARSSALISPFIRGESGRCKMPRVNPLPPPAEIARTLPKHLASLLRAIVAGRVFKDEASPPDLRDLRTLFLISEESEDARTRIVATMYGKEVAQLLAASSATNTE